MINHLIRFIAIIFLSISLLMAVCCDRHGEADSRMDKAESLMVSKPDSALMVLDSITPEMLSGKKSKARYALLKSMALDKNYIDTTTFDVLQPAIDYYLKKGSADEKLRTYYYQGRIYQNRHNPDSAMQSFMRGREYGAQATDTLTLANLMVAQGTILYTTYKYDDFTNVNLDAANLYKEINKTDYEILSLANALDGSIVNQNKQLADSILSIIQERINKNPDLNPTIAPYIISYALNFGNKDDILEILGYYNSMDSITDLTKIDIADAYCRIGDSFNAKRLMDAIDQSAAARKSLKYLAIKPDILEQSGDIAGALEAFRDYSTTLDSIHLDIFSHDLLFAKERHEMEKSNLLNIQKRDRIIWISLSITFLLMLIAVYFYYRYRLGKAKSRLDDEEKKKLHLQQENLQHANEKLELERHNAVLEKQTAELECERQSLVAENFRLKIEQLENESASLKEILEDRKDLAKPIEDAIRIRLEMLNGLLATQITHNASYSKPYDAWRDKLIKDKDKFMNSTRLAFKATHPKFMDYLEQHDLTVDEINYLCLYAIGLRGKEVGEYIKLKRHYNVSSEIRKKLGIDEHETNIGIYIRTLMKKL